MLQRSMELGEVQASMQELHEFGERVVKRRKMQSEKEKDDNGKLYKYVDELFWSFSGSSISDLIFSRLFSLLWW